jgi:hypothetical protein
MIYLRCVAFLGSLHNKVVKDFRLFDYPSLAIESSLKQESLQKTSIAVGENLKVTLLSGILLLAIK